MTGIDVSAAMLEKAGTLDVHFDVMDARQLEFSDRSFDVAVLSFTLHDMPARSRTPKLATKWGAPDIETTDLGPFAKVVEIAIVSPGGTEFQALFRPRGAKCANHTQRADAAEGLDVGGLPDVNPSSEARWGSQSRSGSGPAPGPVGRRRRARRPLSPRGRAR